MTHEDEAAESGPPSRRRRRWLLVTLLVVAVVAVFLEVAFVVTAASDTACTVCHQPGEAEESLAHSTHSEQGCLSCHLEEGRLGLVRLNIQAVQNLGSAVLPEVETPPDKPRYVQERCEDCHEPDLTDPVTVGDIKMSHEEPREARYRCIMCHPYSAHPDPDGSAAPDAHTVCAACHANDISANNCVVCHATDPLISPAPVSRSHPEDWAAGHGSGDLKTCSFCHSGSYCRDCHGVDLPHRLETFIYTHGTEATEANGACTTACHSEESCDTCHAIPMPHSADYLQIHGDKTFEHGRQTCEACHLGSGCDACHIRHIHPGVADSVIERLERSGSGS